MSLHAAKTGGFCAISLNVHALASAGKLRDSLFFLTSTGVHLALVQETHCAASSAVFRVWLPFALGSSYSVTAGPTSLEESPSSSSRADPSLEGPVQFTAVHGGGRGVRADTSVGPVPVCVVGVFAPCTAFARACLRAIFFADELAAHCPLDGRPLLMAGDWNWIKSPPP